MLSGAQPEKGRCAVVTPPASSNQFQTYPEGDGDEASGCSDLTGSGIRSKGMVSNVGLCNEMRTVSEHDWVAQAECAGDTAVGVVVLRKEKGAVRKPRSRLLAWKL